MRIKILGSGPMENIPREGHTDEVCKLARKHGAKERRLQSSILLTTKKDNILFDCTENIEEQLSGFNPKNLTAIVISHGHRDAIGGLGKLYKLLEGKKVKLFANKKTISIIKNKFPEIEFKFSAINEDKTYIIGENLYLTPFTVEHSIQEGFPTLGFIIEYNGKKIVYNEDVSKPADDKYYKNKDLLIIDGSMWGFEDRNVVKKELKSTAGHLIVNDEYLKWLSGLGTKNIVITLAAL